MNEPTNKARHSRKIFLPLLVAVAGVLAGGSVSFGAVAIDADFSTYTLGALNAQNSWAQISSGTAIVNPIQVIAASGAVPQSIRVTGVANASQSFRDLPSASRFDPTTGTEAKTFYYVLENFKVIAALNSTTSTGQGFFALTGTVGGGSPTSARLFLRRFGGVTGNTTTFDLGISASGATAVYGATPLTVGASYKIVVAYTANPGLANDVVKVYVNPVGLNPATWTHEVTQTATTDPTVSFKSVQITPGAVSNSTKIDLTIGRIIVGDSPSDVLPLPAAPTSLAATSSGIGGFTANWTASTGATGYYLDVATESGFTSFVAGYNGKDVGAVVSSPVTGSFIAGTTLYYQVRAYNSAGPSANSATQTVSITAAPVVLVPTVTNSATSGTVTWTSGPDWIPNNPVSASNATVTLNGFLNGVLTANNDTASPFVLNSLVFANSGAGTNDVTGGVLQLTNNGTTNPTITFANNSTYQRVSAPIQIDTNVTVSQSGSSASNSILGGVLSGSGGLTKSGAGLVYLTQTNNSFGGPVTIGSGTLVVENIGTAGLNSSLGTNSTISLGGGSLSGTNRWGSGSVTNEQTDKAFKLLGSTGGGAIEVRGTTSLLTLNGAIDTGANPSTRTFTLNGQGGCTVNGEISGNAGLRVNGSESRTVILANGNNSFAGSVTIDGNANGKSYKLQVASIGMAGSNSPLGTNSTINIGSTVSGSYNFLVWSNTVSETTDKTINLAGAIGGHALINNKGPALLKFTTAMTATGAGLKTLYADQDDTNGVTEFAGGIPDSSAGATAMNKNGAGTLILSASNTFTGGFTLKGGTLELKHAQGLATGNVLTFPANGTGSIRVKVAYSGAGSDLGNLLVQTNGTIDLGLNNTAQIRFGSATGWTADKILTVTNSTGGGKLYILETNNVALSQIKSAENPTYPASLALNGLLTFTSPAPANTAPVITSSQAFAANENVSLATVVGTVAATDADANPIFSGWTIVSGNTGSAFAINAETGQITVAGALNYEGTPSYSLGVTVSDGTATSAVGTVVVTVTNVAEYSDVFGSSNPTADDNGDGISNLMAYALGAASPSSLVVPPALNTTDSTKLTITALIRINDPKVSVVGEYGLTPGIWVTDSPIAGVDSVIQAGAVDGVTKKKDFSVDRGTDPKKFIHLKATQVP